MFRIRASRPGSLCARQSRDPGCGGARRARGRVPLQSELPGLLAFCMVRRQIVGERSCPRGPLSLLSAAAIGKVQRW